MTLCSFYYLYTSFLHYVLTEHQLLTANHQKVGQRRGGVGGRWSLSQHQLSFMAKHSFNSSSFYFNSRSKHCFCVCVCVCVCRTQIQGGILLISLQCPLLKCCRPHVMPTWDEEGVLCIAGRVFLRHEKGVEIPETALDEIVCRHLCEPANRKAHDIPSFSLLLFTG